MGSLHYNFSWFSAELGHIAQTYLHYWMYVFKLVLTLLPTVLNQEDSTVRYKISFPRVKNWRKNMCWRICFSSIVHLQKAPITNSSENVPDSQFSA